MACQLILEERNLIDSGLSTAEHVDLLAGPQAASEARGFMRAGLTGVTGADQLDDVLLLTSELVTNVVLHARTDMHLGVTWDHANILVAVQDHSPATDTERGRATIGDDLEESGRGMLIVAALADDFGWRRLPDTVGKVMWFMVAITGPSRAPATTNVGVGTVAQR